ncbi:energy transducer TonB [Candidatus Methylomirabilis sp.]|uniref:energy transducer TonB n=1 Tax=Candidatus Methylomirabilis sp. TaxID=2032687 RepID=UPI0030763E24
MMPAGSPQIRNFIIFSLLAHLVLVGLLSVMQLSARLPADRPLQVRIINQPVHGQTPPPRSHRILKKFAARAHQPAKKIDQSRISKKSGLARLKAAPLHAARATPPTASPTVAKPDIPSARHAALTPWVPPPLRTLSGPAVTPNQKPAHIEPLEGEGVGGSTRASDLRGQLALLWKSLDAQQYPDQGTDAGEGGDIDAPGGPTVSLDSKDSRFASYLLGVKRRIENVWSYPQDARGLTGNLVITFGITRDGRLSDLQLTQTSGIAPLDNEAIRAIRQATPFGPFPERMSFERLNIRAAFYYHVSRASPRDQ